MPRVGWLAVGAIAAAMAIPVTGWSTGLAGLALGVACFLVAWWWSARKATRSGLVVLAGAAMLLARFAVGPSMPPATDVVPDGHGPWRFEVETVGSARAGQQTATLRSSATDEPQVRVAATLPAYPEVTSGDRVTVDGSIRPRPDSAYGAYLERIGAVGTLTGRSMTRRASTGRCRACDRSRPPGRSVGTRGRPARTRGGTGRGHPRRAARPRRPRSGRRLHDGRCQPRRRDLGLEHRDRRRCGRGDGRADAASPPLDPDDGRDRRVRRLRRCVGIGRAGRGDGRRRPAGARIRPCRTCRRGTGLGRGPAARRRSVAHPRRRASSCPRWPRPGSSRGPRR